MLIVFIITVTPSTVTFPPMPAACAAETTVKQSAATGAKNNIRCILICIFSYEFSEIPDGAVTCAFNEPRAARPALEIIKSR
jgi:hypothetical protein